MIRFERARDVIIIPTTQRTARPQKDFVTLHPMVFPTQKTGKIGVRNAAVSD
jgi:hypothetical protein